MIEMKFFGDYSDIPPLGNTYLDDVFVNSFLNVMRSQSYFQPQNVLFFQ